MCILFPSLYLRITLMYIPPQLWLSVTLYLSLLMYLYWSICASVLCIVYSVWNMGLCVFLYVVRMQLTPTDFVHVIFFQGIKCYLVYGICCHIVCVACVTYRIRISRIAVIISDSMDMLFIPNIKCHFCLPHILQLAVWSSLVIFLTSLPQYVLK
jgi:hypothetical protein